MVCVAVSVASGLDTTFLFVAVSAEADAALFFLVSFFIINPFVLHSLMYYCRLVYHTTWFYGESLYPYIYTIYRKLHEL